MIYVTCIFNPVLRLDDVDCPDEKKAVDEYLPEYMRCLVKRRGRAVYEPDCEDYCLGGACVPTCARDGRGMQWIMSMLPSAVSSALGMGGDESGEDGEGSDSESDGSEDDSEDSEDEGEDSEEEMEEETEEETTEEEGETTEGEGETTEGEGETTEGETTEGETTD